MCVCVCVSCLVVSDSLQPTDCSPPAPSIHRILQARTLEWVAISFSKKDYRKKESEVAQSCPTLCDPMDCSLPGSSIHGIFQARVLEWVAISFSTFYSSGLNTVDGLVGMAVLTPHPHPCLAQLVAKPALCRSCWQLGAGMGHKTAQYSTLGIPEASVGPLVG